MVLQDAACRGKICCRRGVFRDVPSLLVRFGRIARTWVGSYFPLWRWDCRDSLLLLLLLLLLVLGCCCCSASRCDVRAGFADVRVRFPVRDFLRGERVLMRGQCRVSHRDEVRGSSCRCARVREILVTWYQPRIDDAARDGFKSPVGIPYRDPLTGFGV